MDFDHLSDKISAVSTIYTFIYTGNLGTAEREIAKYKLVCSNCHRQRTHDRLFGASH